MSRHQKNIIVPKEKTENFIPKEVFEYDVIASKDSEIYRLLLDWPKEVRHISEDELRERIPGAEGFNNYSYVAQRLMIPDWAFRRVIYYYDKYHRKLELPSSGHLRMLGNQLVSLRDIILSDKKILI